MIPDKTAGRDGQFSIPLIDANEEVVDAETVAWQLFDDAGLEVTSGDVSSFQAGDPAAEFTIDAEFLELEPATTFSGRELVLVATTADDVVEIRDYFVLVNARPLSRFANTLLTMAEAVAMRREFGPVVDAWDAATTDDRVRALIHAYDNLSRISYRVQRLPVSGDVRDYAAWGTGTDEIFDISRKVRIFGLDETKFGQLPTRFKSALRRAQFMEADTILGGDAIGKVRQDGIISETIGESSTFYNSKPYLNLPINRRTFEILKPYIVFSVGISR